MASVFVLLNDKEVGTVAGVAYLVLATYLALKPSMLLKVFLDFFRIWA